MTLRVDSPLSGIHGKVNREEKWRSLHVSIDGGVTPYFVQRVNLSDGSQRGPLFMKKKMAFLSS